MSNLKKILVISDSEGIVTGLNNYLLDSFEIQSNSTLDIKALSNSSDVFEFILIDYLLLNDFNTNKQNDEYYISRIELFQEYFPGVRVIIISDAKRIDDASSLLKHGYHNIIQVPFSKDILKHRLSVELERVQFQAVAKETGVDLLPKKKLFTTENSNFAKAIEELEQVALSRSTILITGESGTGKSLLAKYIHELSSRNNHHFIEVHCGAIPETLVESELFGHEKGSFTGAIRRKIGRFELANQGTIFLDEVGTISRPVQVRLLQVLQERFVQRVGGEANINLDIRVIAATNDNLKELVKSGEFREDLFYRLNVFQIEIPALRNRKEDIPLLCQSILSKLNALYDKKIKEVSANTLSIFHNYEWPGNVRELENILERAYILEKDDIITPRNIPREIIPANQEMVLISPLDRKNIGLADARKEATEAFEKKYLTELLIAHAGKVSAMAGEAKVTVRQLHKLMAKHSIKSKNFSIILDDSSQATL